LRRGGAPRRFAVARHHHRRKMPTESPEKYIARTGLTAHIEKLLDSCCRDLPEIGHLQPYLLAELIQSNPQSATKVEVDPEAKKWTKKPSTFVLYEKPQLIQYLDDVRWYPTLQAITEQVLTKRPANPVQFLIELLAKGDLTADVDGGDEEAAAAKMQALQRGKKARQQAAAKKQAKEDKKQAEAATQMQSIRRGQMERKAMKEKRLEAEQAMKEEAMVEEQAAPTEEGAVDPEQAAAAAKMQALQRGKKARDEYMAQRQEKAEQDAAATKMQAVRRGQAERKERAEEAAAATKMQALQRGKNARKAKE